MSTIKAKVNSAVANTESEPVQVPAKKVQPLTAEDVKFLAYNFEEWKKILANGHSVPHEDPASDQARIDKIMSACSMRPHFLTSSLPDKLTLKDYFFVQFALTERNDFLNDDIGTPWFKNPRDDAIKAQKLTEKIRVILGLDEGISEVPEIDNMEEFDEVLDTMCKEKDLKEIPLSKADAILKCFQLSLV